MQRGRAFSKLDRNGDGYIQGRSLMAALAGARRLSRLAHWSANSTRDGDGRVIKAIRRWPRRLFVALIRPQCLASAAMMLCGYKKSSC